METTGEPDAIEHSIDGENFIILLNADEQHSVWPARKPIPGGWSRVGPEGSKQVCVEFIEANWTDMRPRSLRSAMGASSPGDDAVS